MGKSVVGIILRGGGSQFVWRWRWHERRSVQNDARWGEYGLMPFTSRFPHVPASHSLSTAAPAAPPSPLKPARPHTEGRRVFHRSAAPPAATAAAAAAAAAAAPQSTGTRLHTRRDASALAAPWSWRSKVRMARGRGAARRSHLNRLVAVALNPTAAGERRYASSCAVSAGDSRRSADLRERHAWSKRAKSSGADDATTEASAVSLRGDQAVPYSSMRRKSTAVRLARTCRAGQGNEGGE